MSINKAFLALAMGLAMTAACRQQERGSKEMRADDEFRDPRVNPMRDDKVNVDLGDGEYEARNVVDVQRQSGGEWIVRFTIEGSAAEHTMRLRDWREYANDSVVLHRGGAPA